MHRYESAFPEACSAEEFVVRERVCTRMCKYSKVIIVDSGVGKRQVEESYGKGLKAKTAILPFLPPPYIMENLDKSENDYVIHKFGLQEKFLFYPAAFWKHKNHHGLVEAIKLLGERGLNVNAVFVGPQKNNYGYVLELINKYKLKERITILGYVDNQDIVSLYKKSVALVMPSFFGPTNIPIIEAMFLGVPVLCANVYAMPEQVGDAGLVFDNTPEDMAMKIAAVWTDEKLRQLIREKALKRVQEFSLEKHAEKMKRILCLAANDE